MSFFEHLEDLRFTIIRSILSIFIFAIAAFLFKDIIFNTIILGPQKSDFITNRLLCELGSIIGSDAICINQNNINIINIEMAGQFKAHLLISIIAGLVLGMPVVLREIWVFIKPALKPGEQSGYYFSLFLSSLLFFIGVAFGYFILSPITIDFLSNYVLDSSIDDQIRLGSYVRIVTLLCLATGMVFEMPLIIIPAFAITNAPFAGMYARQERYYLFQAKRKNSLKSGELILSKKTVLWKRKKQIAVPVQNIAPPRLYA